MPADQWRGIFESASGVTVPRSELETHAQNQVYLKPWTGPWEKREFPDNAHYKLHVRRFCELTSAHDGEGEQLWGIPEDWMVVTQPAGLGAHVDRRTRGAWHLVLPGEVPVSVPRFLADLTAAPVNPSLRDNKGNIQIIHWSWWNGLKGSDNYLLITCDGLAAKEKLAHALIPITDLLNALEIRAKDRRKYNDFLEAVHADLADIPLGSGWSGPKE